MVRNKKYDSNNKYEYFKNLKSNQNFNKFIIKRKRDGYSPFNIVYYIIYVGTYTLYTL